MNKQLSYLDIPVDPSLDERCKNNPFLKKKREEAKEALSKMKNLNQVLKEFEEQAKKD